MKFALGNQVWFYWKLAGRRLKSSGTIIEWRLGEFEFEYYVAFYSVNYTWISESILNLEKEIQP